MLLKICHSECRGRSAGVGKLRPASQSYLHHVEAGVAATIACVCAALIFAGVWLVRLLG